MSETELAATLAAVRRRIETNGKRGLNEQNTKATLIEPVLRALGWRTEDVDEVVREYKGKRQRKPVDYGLLTRREPRLLVEAKPLGASLNDNKWANQIMGYASVAGVKWMVLTDGNEYRIYNTHAPVPVDQKLWRKVRVSDGTPIVQETLDLLAKTRLDENRIDALWDAHFVDRQVGKALRDMFEGDDDKALVTWVKKRAPGLAPAEIRSSLRRCQAAFDFPPPATGTPAPAGEPPTAGKPPKTSMAAGSEQRKSPEQHTVTVQQLLTAGLLKAPAALTYRYKGHDLSATINADGSVSCLGETFGSLSLAASAARASVIGAGKDGKPPPTNGWTFWRVRGPEGKAVSVAAIREIYAGRKGG